MCVCVSVCVCMCVCVCFGRFSSVLSGIEHGVRHLSYTCPLIALSMVHMVTLHHTNISLRTSHTNTHL